MIIKKILLIVVLIFIGMAVYRFFRVDSTDPTAVLRHYLSHWESNNTTGMYPLISTHAKNELRKSQQVNNAADYYSFFMKRRSDLSSFQITSQQFEDRKGRFWVTMKILDYVGKENSENATFFMVKEGKNWRVDGWQKGETYCLP